MSKISLNGEIIDARLCIGMRWCRDGNDSDKLVLEQAFINADGSMTWEPIPFVNTLVWPKQSSDNGKHLSVIQAASGLRPSLVAASYGDRVELQLRMLS